MAVFRLMLDPVVRLVVLADQPPLRGGAPPAPDPRPLVWQYLILLVVALVGVLLIYALARWRKRAGQDRLTASEQLSDFRTLYENGQLSREEFDRLRSLLGERLRRETEAPAAKAPPALPPPKEGLPPADAIRGPRPD